MGNDCLFDTYNFPGDLNSDGLDDVLIGAYGFDHRSVVAVGM